MKNSLKIPNCPRCKSAELFLPKQYFPRNVFESLGYMKQQDFPHCMSCSLDLKGYFPWLSDHIRQDQLKNWNEYIQKRLNDGWILDKDWSPEQLNCFWNLHTVNVSKNPKHNYVSATMTISGDVFEYRGLLSEKEANFGFRLFIGTCIGALFGAACQRALGIEFFSWAGITIFVTTAGIGRHLARKFRN
jgi:hypothetical protein